VAPGGASSGPRGACWGMMGETEKEKEKKKEEEVEDDE
jgi:hypothetical protein